MRRLPLLAAASVIAGCTVGPDFTPPDVPSPASYGSEPAVSSRTYGGAVDVDWWTSFRDPELTTLVDRLAAQNLDLQAAAERIEQARAQVAVVRSQALPHVGADAKYSRKRVSPNGPVSLFEPAPGASPEFDQFQLETSASWELDLFGRVRRMTEMARADLTAQVETRHALALAAIAELARTYMELRQVQALRALLAGDIDVARRRSRLVSDRFAQGAANGLDVAQADAQLSAIKQSLPGLQAQEAALSNALALLLAEPPRALVAELAERSSNQPPVPPAVPIGLPGSLVRRRPDIRRAEVRLHAATAQTGVAVASFYPDISFTGGFGIDSLQTGTLFEWASRAFALTPTVSLPIFEGGRLTGDLKLAEARQREAAIGFHQTVLQAWHDVDNALTAYARAQQTQADTLATLDANRRVLSMAQQRYEQGATNFLDVVEGQSAVIGSQNAVVRATAAVETSLVSLYKALGGGWQAVPDPAPGGDAELARTRSRPVSRE